MNLFTEHSVPIEAVVTLIQLLEWNTVTILNDPNDNIGKDPCDFCEIIGVLPNSNSLIRLYLVYLV